MTRGELEDLWKGLSHSGSSEYEFCRIDSICIPELNIGLNSAEHRCLLLELPQGSTRTGHEAIKENLTMKWYSDTGYIVIQLTEAWYNDLFNDLILSIYQNISRLGSSGEYIPEFIRTFNKWSGFFAELRTHGLSQDLVRGLLGELMVLRHMLIEAKPGEADDILSSWTGPYDQVRDFMTDVGDTEVKTAYGGTDIKISSEHQLEPELGKGLNLAVVLLEMDQLNGFSLRTLVLELRSLIDGLSGNQAILLDALFQKGLTIRSLGGYDNQRYRAMRITWYDCLKPGFPALVRSKIPAGIYGVTFRIRLSTLAEYIIETKEL